MTIYLACALFAAGVGGGIAASVASRRQHGLLPGAARARPAAARRQRHQHDGAGVLRPRRRCSAPGRNWRASATGCSGWPPSPPRAAPSARRSCCWRRPAPSRYVVPVLIASSSVALILQPRLRGARPAAGRRAVAVAARRACSRVAVYIGYFGAAGGVLMLAMLAATLTESLIRVNAIKNVVGGAANLVAAVIFACYAPGRLGVRAAAGGSASPSAASPASTWSATSRSGCCGSSSRWPAWGSRSSSAPAAYG